MVNSFGESFDVTTNHAAPLRAAAPLPFGEGLGVGLPPPLRAAAPLPIGEGLGVGLGWCGLAATSHLAATTATYLNHSGFGRLVAEWQQKTEKKFFYTKKRKKLIIQGNSVRFCSKYLPKPEEYCIFASRNLRHGNHVTEMTR